MTKVSSKESGFVSVETMAQFDSMLGINACMTYGLARLAQDKVTTEVSNGAVAVLNSYWNYPIGTEIPFIADNITYIGRIELHYHPYNGSMTPYGYHHGVSVLYYSCSTRMTGTEFLEYSNSMSIDQREAHILLQLSIGNIPPIIKNSLHDITVTSVQNNSTLVLTYHVLADYLAVGSDEDYIRVPCMAYTAQKLADLYRSSLPTTRMVDQIWSAAGMKLDPQPISPSDSMCDNAYIANENELIETQVSLQQVGKEGQMIGGDKKDTVLTNQYASHPTSVAEYGWHQSNGVPIQPLYMGHSASWADYSMGIRLISNTVTLMNTTGSSKVTTQMMMADVLKSAALAPMLSSEGVIASPRVPVLAVPAAACWTPPSSLQACV